MVGGVHHRSLKPFKQCTHRFLNSIMDYLVPRLLSKKTKTKNFSHLPTHPPTRTPAHTGAHPPQILRRLHHGLRRADPGGEPPPARGRGRVVALAVRQHRLRPRQPRLPPPLAAVCRLFSLFFVGMLALFPVCMYIGIVQPETPTPKTKVSSNPSSTDTTQHNKTTNKPIGTPRSIFHTHQQPTHNPTTHNRPPPPKKTGTPKSSRWTAPRCCATRPPASPPRAPGPCARSTTSSTPTWWRTPGTACCWSGVGARRGGGWWWCTTPCVGAGTTTAAALHHT